LAGVLTAIHQRERHYRQALLQQAHNAFTPASEQAIRQLAFRDFLRKHHGIAEQHKHPAAAEDRRQNPAAYGRLKTNCLAA
jgi:hypothetical protein